MSPPDASPLKNGNGYTSSNTGDYGSTISSVHTSDSHDNDDVPAPDPFNVVSKAPRPVRRRASSQVLIKTQKSFYQDAVDFSEGTIPHSMVLALTIGIVCGVAAYVYYAGLEWALEFLWKTLPEHWLVSNENIPESLYFLWIPLVGFIMATGLGLTVCYMGEPGDLPYTIKCVHDKAYVAMDHVLPMVCASQFSILGGGSLGPEAPLVAICAALGGFVSRTVFSCRQRNLIRKHTLMGVSVYDVVVVVMDQ